MVLHINKNVVFCRSLSSCMKRNQILLIILVCTNCICCDHFSSHTSQANHTDTSLRARQSLIIERERLYYYVPSAMDINRPKSGLKYSLDGVRFWDGPVWR